MSKTKAKEETNKIVEVEKNELAQESKFTVDSSDTNSRYSLRQASSKFKAGETGDLVKDQEYVVIPASSETDIIFVDVRKSGENKHHSVHRSEVVLLTHLKRKKRLRTTQSLKSKLLPT